MSNQTRIGRRAACAAMLGGGSLLASGVAAGQPLRRRPARPRPALSYTNDDFYQSDGTFDVDAAKDVYLDLLKLANYPIPKRLRAEMFAKDWDTGRFTEVGLGGVFWINDKEWNYTSLEMFLLPNQMIPEHWHVGDEADGIRIKMESWHVRWGKTYTYGAGEPTEKLSVNVPDFQARFVTALCETPLGVGEVCGLKKPLEKHWQQAAPSGCILTEPSTYHSDDLMRYTNPNLGQPKKPDTQGPPQ